jgi:NADH-quinone oxidoreductase subunit N
VILAIVTSLIGVYYYFKPIMAMFGQRSEEQLHFARGQKIIVGALTLLIILMGLLPDALISLMG